MNPAFIPRIGLEDHGPQVGPAARTIVTHAGAAHSDEVVASAILLASNPAIQEIRRVTEPTENDMASNEVYVLDIGRRHEANRLNFDHHQFPRSDPPRCALTLILEHLGLEPAARRFWSWLPCFERCDVDGPHAVADHLGEPGLKTRFHEIASPIMNAVVGAFSHVRRIDRSEPVFGALALIGEELLLELQRLPEMVQWFSEHTERWSDATGTIVGLIAQRFPPDPAGLAMSAFAAFHREAAPNVRFTVTPNQRGEGWTVCAGSSPQPIDFRRFSGHPQISYVHPSGHMMVTRDSDLEKVRPLLPGAANRHPLGRHILGSIHFARASEAKGLRNHPAMPQSVR